ncbi:RDD family protein [Zhongshania aquimaris]|uniref:RDD family protein n=1 Tax=Zhongshania aquimaris TaxID=2857107 RepID=A0ABS6VP96_9GAMM|nr:RDD family protein [Zhongshania aquimaris]MBW2940144.1 RDD family protein [Zhongshania aquimaris]
MENTPQASEQQLEYAGFWVRVLASVIDTFLFGLLILPIIALSFGDAQWSSVEGEGMHMSTMSFETLQVPGNVNVVVNYILPAIVVLVFWIYKSATPGKMILKLAIVDAKTGGKPTLKQWLVRYVCYYLSAMVLMLGFIWVGLDRRKQGWHDKIARTVVISNKNKEPVQFDH